MEQQGPPTRPPRVPGLASVARMLRDREARNTFVSDPKRALEGAGVDPASIPSPVMDTLSQMSPDERSAVIRFNDALVEAGLAVEPPDDEEDVGPVRFF